MDTFFKSVYALVARIPRGSVASYGLLARMLGNPRMARQVGWALRACPGGLPWQRVVRADGTFAGGADPEVWREMLAAEGISFLPDGRVDMARCLWRREI